MKQSHKLLSCLLAAALTATTSACGNSNNSGTSESGIPDSDYVGYDESLRVEDERNITDVEYSYLNVVGTDDYGREIVAVDGREEDKVYVGMFFFLTLGQHTNHSGIYDVSKITVDGTDLDAFQSDSAASPLGAAHIWGEPVWGYYNSTDEWVIRKQIELLTMAGIDFIVLDTSNGVLYKKVTDVLFKVMLDFSEKGYNVPKVMYYLQANNADNSTYFSSLETVYNYFYADAKYENLWFAPNGKPMITRHELATDTVIQNYKNGIYWDFFEFKTRQWPINDVFKEDGASWMEFEYPQPLHGDWMSVSVAQHYSVRFSDIYGTHGRGWNEATYKNDHTDFGSGLNYQTQWDTAFDSKNSGSNLKYTFITGWNEWVAEKKYDGVTYFTVDQFNEEYSRDIEPTMNSIGDNFYLQTVNNIKKFNYTEAKHYVYPKTNVDITSDSSAWDSIRGFVDFSGDATERNSIGMVAKKTYTNKTNRNDIETIKVARDDDYMYFRVTCAADITAYQSGDEGWMNILINTDNANDTFNGYNYVINRSVSGNVTKVMKSKGGKLTEVGEGEVYVYGEAMIVKVPLATLGLTFQNYHIQFKVADNIADFSDYRSFYNTGDAAPIGRLNYEYGY